MKSPATVRSIVIAALATIAGGQALAVDPIFLNAMTTWGHNGDGWWAPGENAITYLTSTDSQQRSLAYNPVTKKVYLVNALSVRVLDEASGASVGLLNTTGISGGDRALNQIGVTSDGQIYGSNLRATMSATATFKVYRWNDESAAPTTEYNGNVRTGGRLGDSFDVSGSGANVQVAAGFGGTGSGYAVLSGSTAMTAVDYPVAGTAGGDFRLGLAYYDADTVFGTQNATAALNGVRISSYNGTTASLDGTLALTDVNERAIDFAKVNGRTIMATIQSNSNKVRVYDISTFPTSGVQTLVAEANLTSGTGVPFANGNATADLAFGAVNGDTVALYALNTNNGIQAFNVQVVPEPGTMIALGAGAAALFARRRKKA